jgi:hypothetical protein
MVVCNMNLEDTQFVSLSFIEHCFSKNQLKVAVATSQVKGGLKLHLDATGAIIRNQLGDKRHIYYYVGVITCNVGGWGFY